MRPHSDRPPPDPAPAAVTTGLAPARWGLPINPHPRTTPRPPPALLPGFSGATGFTGFTGSTDRSDRQPETAPPEGPASQEAMDESGEWTELAALVRRWHHHRKNHR
ncbi:hypothetical protein SAMN05421803_101885 [Nocardiopsis flavescens]|uniref:Uncharacterized protein n=1 Tax=Nocardiopsis flavescens TaxID=758803 RepID=A0A1M6D1D7_9ACTN|nr:hypothetical protein [Nocardiopsis flavescens]SHI66874.1 hypothetical protein SAMN05421803_101885 [Nocardiopsis flavescens]